MEQLSICSVHLCENILFSRITHCVNIGYADVELSWRDIASPGIEVATLRVQKISRI